MFPKFPTIVPAAFAASCCLAASSVDAGKAAPPPSIPTVSTADVARIGFFYAGGHYVGEPGKEIMDGAEYVEVMTPKKMRRAYPIVFLHGAGQTGTDWLQTPDGRPGWAQRSLGRRGRRSPRARRR